MTDPEPASQSSRRLVDRAHRGDRTALDALIGLAQERLHAALRTRMGDALRAFEDSVDVMQSALREAVRDFARFEYAGRGSFQRWLHTIAENKLRHRARDRARARRDADREVELDDLGDGLAARDLGPVAAAVTAEVEEGVRGALESLDDDERDVIVWRQFQALSTAEVAAVLGISEAAASKRYLRALQRLEAALSARGVHPRQ